MPTLMILKIEGGMGEG